MKTYADTGFIDIRPPSGGIGQIHRSDGPSVIIIPRIPLKTPIPYQSTKGSILLPEAHLRRDA